jgi:hypothetical protein
MVAGQTGPRPLVLLRVAPARRLERVPTPPRVVAEANAAALASSSATRRLARAPMVMSIRACLLDSDFHVAIIDCQADYGVLPTTLLCSENSQGAIFRCDSQTICGQIQTLHGTRCVLPLDQAYTYCDSHSFCGGVAVCSDAGWNAVIKNGGTLFAVPPNVATCSANNADWTSYLKLPPGILYESCSAI